MNTKIHFLGQEFSNPVIPASGTFGFGYEFASYYDINVLGSISLKGTTRLPRYGNPLPRISECKDGLLNSIGLQNPGVDAVISEEIPKLEKVYHKKVIANVGGHSLEDYVVTCEKFNDCDKVLAIELNISCPNVKGGGMAFGTDPKVASEIVKAVKKVSTKPIIVKLSPNVTDIKEMARAVEASGADAISLINTLVGMRIDLKTAKPILAVKSGGFSGPAILPVALRMVYDVYEAVRIPIIGMGGIATSEDVIEMMYAGASLVMVGAMNLVDPFVCKKIIDGLPETMRKYRIDDLSEIVGKAHRI